MLITECEGAGSKEMLCYKQRKKRKNLANFLFPQKMLHFVNRVFQHGREFLASSSDKLLHPSVHHALLKPPWPQRRMSHQRGRCEQPLLKQARFTLGARRSHSAADNRVVP